MNKQQGFSLLELLVAFAIMALSLALLYRTAGGSARHTSDAAQYQQAAWLAESLLASHPSVSAQGWNEDGQSSGVTWQARSTPFTNTTGTAAGLSNPQAVPLHRITLGLTWASSARPAQLELVTLRPERPRRPGDTAP